MDGEWDWEWEREQEEGDDDRFERQFADELEVVSEINQQSHDNFKSALKQSRFRHIEQTFEEALAAGDNFARNGQNVKTQAQEHTKQQDAVVLGSSARKRDLDALHSAVEKEFLDHLLDQNQEQGITTPRHKKPRLGAMKRLNFMSQLSSGELPVPDDDITPPSSPDDHPQSQHPSPKISKRDIADLSGMAPMEDIPSQKVTKRVLKRPPVLEDYINVTSSDGTRVYMVLQDEDSSPGLKFDKLHWSGQRQLHLLGVPFSDLKEQVAEEYRRQLLEESQKLSEMLNSQIDEEFGVVEKQEEEAADEIDDETDECSSSTLWVDRFTPRQYTQLLSDDYTNRCLLKWLKMWDTVVFGQEKPVKKSKQLVEKHPSFKQSQQLQQNKWKNKTQITEEILDAELDAHNRPKYKVALLSGPPGLGKTTLAHVIAKHAGYNVVEINASDDRSPEIFKTRIENATQMKSVLGANEKPNCLIIDEIDGAPSAAINTLMNIINRKDVKEDEAAAVGGKKKRKKDGGILQRPIICICNDQYVPSLRQLRQQAFTLIFPPTLPSRLVQRLHEITIQTGMNADMGILMSLCEKAENDIRSCVNTLQFLHGRGKKNLSMRIIQTANVGLKDLNKSLFSVWKEIFQLPKVQRKRIGQDSSLQYELKSSDNQSALDGIMKTTLSTAAQRFNYILHLSTSTGDYEKITQGLFDNFLLMKFKDPTFTGVCLALEWLEFTDILNKRMMSVQNFQLMRYLPFLPVTFHMLFAASSVPRISYPNSQYEAQTKIAHMNNLLTSMVGEISPAIRSRITLQALVSEILCLLLDILSPKLRPVNTQLYSAKEKQQLADLIGAMLSYNLTYHQERTPDGQYVYLLDPNIEDVCRFPDLPARRPMTYQAKQLIAREIELEKMRRVEALLNARNMEKKEAVELKSKTSESNKSSKPCVKNHEQTLKNVLKSVSVKEKVELDFFGRKMDRINIVTTSTVTGAAEPTKETAERFIGKAVGNSDVWFQFNEGVSNAVRRNVYIKDLL
ncbi:chromosome transmission fidelity protein 18 homolog isoform X2 [Stegostoma tigrinum]|uniref:chromosome transmission fidelity protein 18 homolog isoform X2 n=1 Tax=Stegostoma tigrinum TaxID=3053191 RepID=UPI0028708650|nr:chromosome transmission fidelity protein 18 homolog isoform X2 [Stegostoma tigrinum]